MTRWTRKTFNEVRSRVEQKERYVVISKDLKVGLSNIYRLYPKGAKGGRRQTVDRQEVRRRITNGEIYADIAKNMKISLSISYAIFPAKKRKRIYPSKKRKRRKSCKLHKMQLRKMQLSFVLNH